MGGGGGGGGGGEIWGVLNFISYAISWKKVEQSFLDFTVMLTVSAKLIQKKSASYPIENNWTSSAKSILLEYSYISVCLDSVLKFWYS